MARGTSNTVKEGINQVMLEGTVKRILVSTDKVLKFSLDIATKTKNDKYAHAFVTIVSFDAEDDVKEGQFVHVEGAINTSSYNGKFTTEVVADKIKA